jgi:hypothetical protein
MVSKIDLGRKEEKFRESGAALLYVSRRPLAARSSTWSSNQSLVSKTNRYAVLSLRIPFILGKYPQEAVMPLLCHPSSYSFKNEFSC